MLATTVCCTTTTTATDTGRQGGSVSDGPDETLLLHLQGEGIQAARQVRGPQGDPRLLLREAARAAAEDAPGRGRRGHLAQAHRAASPAAPGVGGQARGAGQAGGRPEPRGPG